MNEITFTVGDLPNNIQHIAKQNQKLQGNKHSLVMPLLKNKSEGNFDWHETPQGRDFWYSALMRDDLSLLKHNHDQNLRLYYVSPPSIGNNSFTFYYDEDTEHFEMSDNMFKVYEEIIKFKKNMENSGYLLINSFNFKTLN